MRFKIASVVLLLVCFLFLGVLSGAIPAAPGGQVPWGSLSGQTAEQTVGPSPTGDPRPTAKLASTAKPAELAPSLTQPPSAAPTASARPTGAPRPTASARPAVPPSPAEEASPTPEPTPSAEPAAEDAPAQAVPAAVELWEPAARVVPTTITWTDPLDNDTDYAVSDGQALLGRDPAISLPGEGYQILIIHTHGTEAFTPDGDDQYQATADYRTTDTGHTVIQVGRALAAALEKQGLRVLLDTELYDWPSYNGSYTRCEEAIRQHLAQYPGIAMVIDLHRDALGDDELMYRPVAGGAAKDAAQIMFVIGTDANLEHPHWRDNLALALSLQGLAEEKYPHLMRPTLVSSYRYNQQLTRGSVLMEIGAAGNTLAEAVTAAELFADAVGPALAARIGV